MGAGTVRGRNAWMGAARRWAAALCLAGLALGLPGMALVAPAGVYWLASILIEKVFLKHLRPEDAAAQAAKTQQEETQNDR